VVIVKREEPQFFFKKKAMRLKRGIVSWKKTEGQILVTISLLQYIVALKRRSLFYFNILHYVLVQQKQGRYFGRKE
jgi:hypothetical protein